MNGLVPGKPADERTPVEGSAVEEEHPTRYLTALSSWARRREVRLYAGLIVLALLLASWVLGITPSTVALPFSYSGDVLSTDAGIKGMIEHGWTFTNSSLGAPAGQTLLDYPSSDGAHLLLLKVVSLFIHDSILVTNLYFLLGFALVSATAFYVLRHLGVSDQAAFAVSLVFAFLPFHFFRGVGHLFLGAYWAIPLTTLVAFWVASDEPPFLAKAKFGWRDKRTVTAVVLAVIIGASGIYYAFFSCLILLAVGLYAGARRRHLVWTLPGLLVVGVVVAAAVVSLAPSIVYQRVVGKNPEAAVRQPYEAEFYALKITQLVLPIDGHRNPKLASVKNNYNSGVEKLNPGFLNESEMSTLGILGTLGFFALLAWGVSRLQPFSKESSLALMTPLGVMNLTALLFGTFGGLGSLFAYLVTTSFRGYNRISIFIAFFSLVALAMLLDRFVFSASWAKRAFVTPAIVTALIVFALWDQTFPGMAIDFNAIRPQVQNDRSFVEKVEASVPPGSMIFQLPYVAFPESPPVGQMTDYEHFKAYLYSKTLRWSYGAVRGRETDLWQRQVSGMGPAEFVAAIKAKGFKGVWIDLRGAPDKEQQMRDVLGTEPLKSQDGHLAFFALQ